jgi:hypothetical protein
MSAAGRVLHAGLQLLDRQLVDRHGRACGKIDDLELEPLGDDGGLYVTALHAGPGALLTRLGHKRLGAWVQRAVLGTSASGEGDPTRVAMQRVAEIGDHVTLAADAEDLATHAVERWTRDNIIDHVPGSRHDAPE